MSVTTVVVDGERVPLDVSREKRFFPSHLRKALYVRDHCCIKCGAPAGRTHAHHIRHWADGGQTSLENGCLLCPSCHADVHHNGWEVFIGADHHPWLIPPPAVDPKRTPLRAYNRRTLTVDDLALAG
nr:HNH endonuclease signature motif containing protein [Gordonia sp. SID5947]